MFNLANRNPQNREENQQTIYTFVQVVFYENIVLFNKSDVFDILTTGLYIFQYNLVLVFYHFLNNKYLTTSKTVIIHKTLKFKKLVKYLLFVCKRVQSALSNVHLISYTNEFQNC